LKIKGQRSKIVPSNEGFKIPGTIFTLDGHSDVEFKARIKAGWAKFHSLRQLLCKKGADPRKRIRLFDATVSKTVVWCCGSWALTDRERKS